MDIDKRPGLNDIFTPFGLHSTTRKRDALINSISFESTTEIDVGFSLGVVPFTFIGHYFELPDEGLMALGIDSYEEILKVKRALRNIVNRVTPFAPEKGYIITEEDYFEDTRVKKLKDLRDSNALLTEGKDEFPLTFLAQTPDNFFIERGLVRYETKHGFKFIDPHNESFVRRLRLQVSFPTWLKYEARPTEIGILDEAYLGFGQFYPLALTPTEEPGPLAGRNNGVEIALPDTFVDLSKIQARLVLARNQIVGS